MADSYLGLMQEQGWRDGLPLSGHIVLLVDQSRASADVLRKICIGLGAHIRRADSYESALRHLSRYCPNIVLIDIGLPGGTGIKLVERISGGSPSPDLIIAMSTNSDLATCAIDAGAHCFAERPLCRIDEFQDIILRHFPASSTERQDFATTDDDVIPDNVAVVDDLRLLRCLLQDSQNESEFQHSRSLLEVLSRNARGTEFQSQIQHLSKRYGEDLNRENVIDLRDHVSELLKSATTMC